uniref:Uncharacterized protein n=1 Tax=Gossypium raimondii TaxID=29730 RepID=A0A0D2VK56_GOSRA|nr:hypothetical protein B456_N020600 [Gossypium raimondii]
MTSLLMANLGLNFRVAKRHTLSSSLTICARMSNDNSFLNDEVWSLLDNLDDSISEVANRPPLSSEELNPSMSSGSKKRNREIPVTHKKLMEKSGRNNARVREPFIPVNHQLPGNKNV